jgi:hypothetical protein
VNRVNMCIALYLSWQARWPAVISVSVVVGVHLHSLPQQLVQGVESGHLVGDQMLDAAAPRRRTTGLRAKLDHKGLIARERRLGWGHADLPYAYVRVSWVVPCLACAWRRV